jgi:hypothetical protein
METRHFNPFTIRKWGGMTSLTVAARSLTEHPIVVQLLAKRFGEFSWHRAIDGSDLVFCFEAGKLNLYQVTQKCGIMTIHILRMYDDVRIEADLDSIMTTLREANQDVAAYANIIVALYLPHRFNVSISNLLTLFQNQGVVETDIHGTMLTTKTKLYILPWALKSTLQDLLHM